MFEGATSVDAEARAATALVERYRAGDRSALDALMFTLYPSIRRIVFRLGWPCAREEHEDLVQAALEQLVRSIDSFRGQARVSSWAFGVCQRVVAHARRHERVRRSYRPLAEVATAPQATARADELYEQARNLEAARQALQRLKPEERAAFVLHEVEELPLDEVALTLRCSTRTVKRRLRVARRKLIRM